jgi:cysteine-rich repeat protein
MQLTRFEGRASLVPARALVHPAWWIALAVLALNDHVLKRGGLLPGVVTGKLSDLAGMLVAPALLALCVRARSRRALALCHLAIGAVFAAIKLSPAAATAWAAFMGLVWQRWTIVVDPTDLIALPLLLASYRLFAPVMCTPLAGGWRPHAERVLACIGMYFCVATSKEAEPAPPSPEPAPSCDLDGDGLCPPEDCDDADSRIGSMCCVDEDHDGICLEEDCDDLDPWLSDCTTACSALPMVSEGVVDGASTNANDVWQGCGEGGALWTYTVPGNPGEVRWLTFQLLAHSPHVLAVGSCDFVTTSCSDPALDPRLEAAADAGVVLWIDVTAADAAMLGSYTLGISSEPLVCGDTLRIGPEACDDGNQIDGDGCSADCTIE